MKDMFNMLKKAQEMQGKMKDIQAELAVATVEGKAGQGLVSVTMTGTHEIAKVALGDGALDDKGMLEDLLKVACNDALEKANALAAEKTKAVMGGIPGLPF